MSPFRIEGPACISFSGGRTSALMLRRILDEGLQPDVHVLFANTGREKPQTLDFVRECQERWDVDVRWVERPLVENEQGYVEVTYDTAHREGEPFDQLITERRCLPNPAQRWCTQELKIRVMKKWMQAHGFAHWDVAIGLRADEPRRLARGRKQNDGRKEPFTQEWPLAAAGVRLSDVHAYWEVSPFDLQLKPYEGNCDLCFLKHPAKRERIAKDRPDLNAWWIEQERRTGQYFRLDQPNYAMLPMLGNFFDGVDIDGIEDGIDCHCTD